MNTLSNQQINDTLKMIESSIINCEKVQPKLKEGSSSLALSKNRIKALNISKDLLMKQENQYTKEESEKAVTQITSIRNKSTAGINNAKKGSATYTRFFRIITAMDIILEYLNRAIDLTSRMDRRDN